jgi:hypothetical protein
LFSYSSLCNSRIEKNESIEYEAMSSYGFENKSGKRSLDAGNCKAKKYGGDISILDLFGEQREINNEQN